MYHRGSARPTRYRYAAMNTLRGRLLLSYVLLVGLCLAIITLAILLDKTYVYWYYSRPPRRFLLYRMKSL